MEDLPKIEKGKNIKQLTEQFNELDKGLYKELILDGEGAESLFDSACKGKLESGDLIIAGTDKGINYGEINEDRVVVRGDEDFFAIVDGMGGMGVPGKSEGALSAQILAEKIAKKHGDIDTAIQDAIQEMRNHKDITNGGALFISAKLKEGPNGKLLEIRQAGDCRLIIIKKDGDIRFESEDESLVQILLQSGQITPDQALISPMRNRVSNPISPNGFEQVKKYDDQEVEDGDLVLLMSDGISDNFTPDEISKMWKEENLTPEELFQKISDESGKRMANKEKIIATSNRVADSKIKEEQVYSDGYKSTPKCDNRALIIVEIKNKEEVIQDDKKVGSFELAPGSFIYHLGTKWELLPHLNNNPKDSYGFKIPGESPFNPPKIFTQAEIEAGLENGEISLTAPEEKAVEENKERKAPTQVLEEISQEESEKIFKKVEIHGDEFHGKRLTAQILRENNLLPKYKVNMDGKEIYFTSSPYKLSRSRMAVVGYVKQGEDFIARSYYTSGSQGVWRYLPTYIPDYFEDEMYHYGKGYNEESIGLPVQAQVALAEISKDGMPILEVANPNLIFAGTARNTDKLYEGTYVIEVNKKPVKLGNFSIPKDKRKIDHEKISPEKINLLHSQAPNFDPSKVMYTWSQSSKTYEGDVQMEAIPSNDGTLTYTFCRDKHNRVWIGNIENNSEIQSTGIRQTWVNPEDLGVPAYEYKTKDADQTGGYGNEKLRNGSYVDMFENYLSQIKVIRNYCESRGIPLPILNSAKSDESETPPFQRMIIPIEQQEPIEKEEEALDNSRLKEENVKSANNLEELLNIIRSSNGLVKINKEENTEETLPPEKLEELILKVMSGEIGLNYITKTEGLREKVKELLYENLAEEDIGAGKRISSIYIDNKLREFKKIETQYIPKFPDLIRVKIGNERWKVMEKNVLNAIYEKSDEIKREVENKKAEIAPPQIPEEEVKEKTAEEKRKEAMNNLRKIIEKNQKIIEEETLVNQELQRQIDEILSKKGNKN